MCVRGPKYTRSGLYSRPRAISPARTRPPQQNSPRSHASHLPPGDVYRRAPISTDFPPSAPPIPVHGPIRPPPPMWIPAPFLAQPAARAPRSAGGHGEADPAAEARRETRPRRGRRALKSGALPLSRIQGSGGRWRVPFRLCAGPCRVGYEGVSTGHRAHRLPWMLPPSAWGCDSPLCRAGSLGPGRRHVDALEALPRAHLSLVLDVARHLKVGPGREPQ